MGVGLRHPMILGPLIWVLAAARLAVDKELRLLMLFYVTLPFTGFFVGRDYWGFLVVPFTLLWAGEAVVLGSRWLTEHVFRRARTSILAP